MVVNRNRQTYLDHILAGINAEIVTKARTRKTSWSCILGIWNCDKDKEVYTGCKSGKLLDQRNLLCRYFRCAI
jgi:hypothetical protein